MPLLPPHNNRETRILKYLDVTCVHSYWDHASAVLSSCELRSSQVAGIKAATNFHYRSIWSLFIWFIHLSWNGYKLWKMPIKISHSPRWRVQMSSFVRPSVQNPKIFSWPSYITKCCSGSKNFFINDQNSCWTIICWSTDPLPGIPCSGLPNCDVDNPQSCKSGSIWGYCMSHESMESQLCSTSFQSCKLHSSWVIWNYSCRTMELLGPRTYGQNSPRMFF